MTLPHKATLIASITAFVMTVIKFAVGILTGSMAVVASAIDSLLDMLMSLFNLYAVRTSEKSPDARFNYGRGKIEGLASLFEGVLIALSGLFIIYQATHNLLHKHEVENIGIALWVMVFSTIVTLFLVIFLVTIGKKTSSLVIEADTLHYKSDLYVNIGIIISLVLIFYTDMHWIDSAVSILIAVFIIFSAYKIIKEGVLMLLDQALDSELTRSIEQIIINAPKVKSHHFLRTRRSANMNCVDVHLVFDEKILLRDAHAVSDQVEAEIASLDEGAKWLITVHLDPKDDSKMEESFINE